MSTHTHTHNAPLYTGGWEVVCPAPTRGAYRRTFSTWRAACRWRDACLAAGWTVVRIDRLPRRPIQ